MLFKPEHVQPILEGEKTQTRRAWKRWPVKVGGVYQCQTKLYDNSSVFARIRVLRRWEEHLGNTSVWVKCVEFGIVEVEGG